MSSLLAHEFWSSTYLYHIASSLGVVSNVLLSKCSTWRLATTGDIRDPIAISCFFLRNSEEELEASVCCIGLTVGFL